MGGDGTTPPTNGRTTAGPKAKLKNGYAIPPASAPNKVKAAIEAANEIVKGKPYCMGGGHGRRRDTCYDCSGSVSYALTGAGLLDASMPSGSFMNWEKGGKGRWITTYANEGHIYAVIAGLRLDTSMTTGDGPGGARRCAPAAATSPGIRPASRRTRNSNYPYGHGPPEWRAVSVQGTSDRPAATGGRGC